MKKVKSMGLPLSHGYELASFLTRLPYEKAKAYPDEKIDDEKAAEILERLEGGEPAAYIAKRREFYGREFYVDETVLIPRVETEILVDAALDFGRNLKRPPMVLDLCSGSGCILLSILSELGGAWGTGVDISPEAVNTAGKNAALLGLEERARFEEGDAREWFSEELYDIAVCNPPYVSEEEYGTLEKQVGFEPKIALVPPEEVLAFYKKILRNIPLLCKKDGRFFLETGRGLGASVCREAKDMGFNAYVMEDMAGIDRAAVISFR